MGAWRVSTWTLWRSDRAAVGKKDIKKQYITGRRMVEKNFKNPSLWRCFDVQGGPSTVT